MNKHLEDLTTKLEKAADAEIMLRVSQMEERKALTARLDALNQALRPLQMEADAAIAARQEYLSHLLGPWHIHSMGGGLSADGLPAALIHPYDDIGVLKEHVCLIRCRRIIPTRTQPGPRGELLGEPFLQWERTGRFLPNSVDCILGPVTDNPRRDLEGYILQSENVLKQQGWVLSEPHRLEE